MVQQQTLLNGTTLASQLNGHMIQDNEQQSPTANKKMISNGIIQLKSTTSSPSTDQPITSLNNIELETNKDMNDLNTTSTTISATNTEQSKSLTDKEDRKSPNPQQQTKRETTPVSNDKQRQFTDKKQIRTTSHSSHSLSTYARSLRPGLVPTPTVGGYPWHQASQMNWPANYYVAGGHQRHGQVNPIVYGYQPTAYIQYPSHHVLGGGSHPNSSSSSQSTSRSNSTNPYSGDCELQDGEKLSKTNLYIRGLPISTTDDDLVSMCKVYGNIISTKAILHKDTNQCKGYGFVDFDNPASAQRAVASLQSQGVQAQMAKQQEQDPTNLYISNLPKTLDEQTLQQILMPYGNVISTRILRDSNGCSKCVGFARMESKEICEKIINSLNGKYLQGSSDPLLVKFADGGPKKAKPDKVWRSHDESYMGYDVRSPVSSVPSQPTARVTPVVQNQMMSPSGVNWGVQQQSYTVVSPQGVPVSPVDTATAMQSNITHMTNQMAQMQMHGAPSNNGQYIVPGGYPSAAAAHQNTWHGMSQQSHPQSNIQESPVIMTATEVESNYPPPQIQTTGPQQHMPHVVSSELYSDDQQNRVYYARK
ncbi:RNA-binding motif, single-stranded-interacting protein 2-like isoform X4 [Clytia hemisphaerica]|uniref:RRM domain-containing protein n=1 Tax=Clytia hemisphaerica TaxID=252671 RepID=A0A7M5X696_9CNID|eukprot:TCONS_00004986-protein